MVRNRGSAEHDRLRRAVFQTRQAHIQARRIRFDRPGPHQDRITARALEMSMGAGAIPGNPLAAAIRQRDTTVQ